jgi:hypothetical protein
MIGKKPTNNESFIELRVAYPSQARVSLIAGLSRSCGLNRVGWIVDEMYHRRDRLVDGSQEQVYRLPLELDVSYEIAETIDGRRGLRYVAVCNGILHRITRDAVERIAEGSMTLRQWMSMVDDDEYGDIL